MMNLKAPAVMWPLKSEQAVISIGKAEKFQEGGVVKKWCFGIRHENPC